MADAGATAEAIALAVEAVEASAGGGRSPSFERQRQNDERVWVYVIGLDHAEDDLTKVGISQHPGLRLKTLERERGLNLYLAHTEGPFSRTEALSIEREAHSALAKHRHEGEWFLCPPETATEVVVARAKASLQ